MLSVAIFGLRLRLRRLRTVSGFAASAPSQAPPSPHSLRLRRLRTVSGSASSPSQAPRPLHSLRLHLLRTVSGSASSPSQAPPPPHRHALTSEASALAPMWTETAGRRQGSGWLQVLGNAEGIGAESKGQGVSETWRACVAGAGVRSVLPDLVHEQSVESSPLRLHHPLL
ncbi:unnamed protein product [Leuciscus chuanchicus]